MADIRPLLERKPREIQAIVKKMKRCLEAGIGERAACRYADITLEQWEEMCALNKEMRELRESTETTVGTYAILNIADAVEKGDVRTSRWYLERTDDKFSNKQNVNVGGIPVVVPIEQKEEELAKLIEQFDTNNDEA